MDEKEILTIPVSVTMPVAQWNTVLACIQNGPFNQVAPIIKDIKDQADPQVNKAVAASQQGEPSGQLDESPGPAFKRPGRPKKVK